MSEFSLEFPVNPSASIETAITERGFESLDFAVSTILAASAHADKRMNKVFEPSNRGINTQVVYELLEPYQARDILPAEIDSFIPYITGSVFAKFSRRGEFDRRHSDSRFFEHRARLETVEQADLDEDIHGLFVAAINEQEVSTYLREMISGIQGLTVDDDFPYRSLKSRDDVTRFWGYLINGGKKQPGILETAATLEFLSPIVRRKIGNIFGVGAVREVNDLVKAVIYLRTSNRKPSETTREIVTPLMQSFNSGNIGQIRSTIQALAMERPELFYKGFEPTLGIDRDEIERQAQDQLAMEEQVRQQRVSEGITSVLNDQYWGEIWSETRLDKAANIYVNDNRWRTYFKGKKEKFVLLDIQDWRGADSRTQVPIFTPRLRFVRVNDEGVYPKGFQYKYILGRDFFRELRQGKIISGAVNTRTLEDMLIGLDESESLRKNIAELLSGLREEDAH
ncbi:MAG TPA: hypothetical protein VMR34_04350 [Candidatus Saccharimonadales bacterium]|nr:hypothetical protein [Candidatus Saccharimonadales bacterium]